MKKNKNLLLSPSEVSRDNILWILEKAQFNAEAIHDDDEDMICCRQYDWNFLVRIDPEKEIITFHCPIQVDPMIPLKRKLRFVNEISKKFILVNLVLLDENSMLCEYQFLYDGGMTVRFLLDTLKRFMEITQNIAEEASRHHIFSNEEVEEEENDDPFNLFQSDSNDEQDNNLPAKEESVDMDELMRKLFEPEPEDDKN